MLRRVGPNFFFSISPFPSFFLFGQPENLTADVHEFMDWAEFPRDLQVVVGTPDGSVAPPTADLHAGRQVALAEILTRHLDIRGRPSKYFFELLSHFASSEMEVCVSF